MPRSQYSVASRKRRKKILKQAKGYKGGKSKLLKTAKESVERAYLYAYIDRRLKKRDFRRLWIARINAAARQNGISYSTLMQALKKNNVLINRKMLAEIAVVDPQAFKNIVQLAQG